MCRLLTGIYSVSGKCRHRARKKHFSICEKTFCFSEIRFDYRCFPATNMMATRATNMGLKNKKNAIFKYGRHILSAKSPEYTQIK